jgi:hypothetical protein
MPSQPMMPTVIQVGGRPFIVHPWSATQTFDALLLLGEVLSEPLSRILGRPVSRDVGSIVEAFNEAGQQTLSAAHLLSLFAALRAAGGSSCLTRVLQTTRWMDRPLDSVAAIDGAFSGPPALLDLMRLTWEVLRYQLGPFVDGLKPLMSSLGAAVEAVMGRTPNASGPTSTGASGAPSSPGSGA